MRIVERESHMKILASITKVALDPLLFATDTVCAERIVKPNWRPNRKHDRSSQGMCGRHNLVEIGQGVVWVMNLAQPD
ncbi:MAG TPA: hypothetical protein DDZ88_10925 [Verrucomicrobiales bacterium]|nr:hypothetical protein [Verrucomicrobiales bacterium]